MIEVGLAGDEVYVQAPARLADLISRIPGLKAEGDVWVGPRTPAVMLAIAADLSKLQGFSPTESAVKYMRAVQKIRTRVGQAKAGAIPEPISDMLEKYEQRINENLRALPEPILSEDEDSAILFPDVQSAPDEHAREERPSGPGDGAEAGGHASGSGRGQDLSEAERTPRAPGGGRGDSGTPTSQGRDRASHRRGQEEQRSGEPASDDAVRAHPNTLALFGHQRSGVALLLRGGVLLGDEMGVGKSPTALAAASCLAHEGQARAVLVVCPQSMTYRWIREAETWFPEAAGIVVTGTKAQKAKALADAAIALEGGAPVVVAINWESLQKRTGLTRLCRYGSLPVTEPGPLNDIDWDVVIADEAHRAKGYKTDQSRGLAALGANARYRWALTGTPVLNTPGDLWAIGRFYDPDTYGTSRHRWHQRFVDSIETQWGPKDIGLRKDRRDEFNAWFDLGFIRRTKDEVLDLPEMTYQIREVPLTTKQRSAYNRMVKDMIVAIDNGILVATDPLALLTRLSQIASATPVIDDSGDVIALDTPSNKVAALFEILDEMDEDRQLVVFAASRKLIELAASELERKGISTVQVTGAVQPELRDANVQRFQNGDVRVALCTLGAGSEGINLYAADTAVFLQRSYSFGQSQQAEARIHRVGQTSDRVTIIDLVSTDTVDEAVIQALLSKEEMAEEVLRDTARELLRSKA